GKPERRQGKERSLSALTFLAVRQGDSAVRQAKTTPRQEKIAPRQARATPPERQSGVEARGVGAKAKLRSAPAREGCGEARSDAVLARDKGGEASHAREEVALTPPRARGALGSPLHNVERGRRGTARYEGRGLRERRSGGAVGGLK